MSDAEKKTSKRGFASLSPERIREISSKGGKAVHAKGNGHRFTSEEARIAGSKGGLAPHTRRGKGKKEDGDEKKADQAAE